MNDRKRSPHVLAAQVVLAVLNGTCRGTTRAVAEHFKLNRSTAARILAELHEAGLLSRRKVRQSGTPAIWVYEVK